MDVLSISGACARFVKLPFDEKVGRAVPREAPIFVVSSKKWRFFDKKIPTFEAIIFRMFAGKMGCFY